MQGSTADARLGEYEVRRDEKSPPLKAELLRTSQGVCCVFSTGDAETFSTGFGHRDGVVLVSEKGTWVRVQMPNGNPKAFAEGITPTTRGFRNADGSYSGLVFDQSNDFAWPMLLTITKDEIVVGNVLRRPLTWEGKIWVSDIMGGYRKLFFEASETKEDEEGEKRELHVTPEVGEEICLEYEMRRLDAQMSKASVADLYRMYNEGRKSDLLMALFLDILLLNRKLNEIEDLYPMDDLVDYLETKGAIVFTKDEEMKTSMVSKILVLTMMLPQLKQKFEALATMYPYFWIDRETRWLKDAFGVDATTKPLATEFRRLVPLIRREVRTVQANTQRTLSEMEASARSLDAVLARQETHDQWQAKVRKFVPIGMQGLFAGGLIFFSGGTNPAAWNMLGNFFASGVLGNLCGIMLQDMEAMTQIQRVANSLFPWWKVFMQASVVSIYEAAQFVDTQNVAAMERDKTLLDAVKDADRPAAIERLKKTLRERITANKKSLLTEKLAGNTVSIKQIASDIDDAVGENMERQIALYVRDMDPGLQS